jgi:hypothetical protein
LEALNFDRKTAGAGTNCPGLTIYGEGGRQDGEGRAKGIR